ncbi:redoxin domain-containing protein [Desulfosediminicola ganghwensis]|uniref:redoxin domain-containing protein n=1 Tax=Desulfosediminicola ganghwensis TaxID=2569540 RepID=UPI0010AC8036|nr:redoxin domain-containing protein [Desulfosediminicola ganghwensis]
MVLPSPAKLLQVIVNIISLVLFSSLIQAKPFTDYGYDPGVLKPVDSTLKVSPGEPAPDFTLTAIDGKQVRLSQFKNQRNVVLSFVPSAWTPICSGQWPGYNISRIFFEQHDAILLGITVDNIPTLYSWTRQMGELWFDVLSDFWPHGEVAGKYGLLRSDGTAERALVFIDKSGIISAIHVSDINVRPPLEMIVTELSKFNTR